eukprot:scaffold5667_cov92-Cylindrotheca_fusiformis.AAC.3
MLGADESGSPELGTKSVAFSSTTFMILINDRVSHSWNRFELSQEVPSTDVAGYTMQYSKSNNMIERSMGIVL